MLELLRKYKETAGIEILDIHISSISCCQPAEAAFFFYTRTINGKRMIVFYIFTSNIKATKLYYLAKIFLNLL